MRERHDITAEITGQLTALHDRALYPSQRTTIMRVLAGLFVELRQHHTRDAGPDWAGASNAYRQTVRGLYRQAQFTPEQSATIQAGVRYHLGNLLRERLTPQQLHAAGLLAASPLQRTAAYRTRNLATLHRLMELAGMTQPAAAMALDAR